MNDSSKIVISDDVFAELLRRSYTLRSEELEEWGYPTVANQSTIMSQRESLVCSERFYVDPNTGEVSATSIYQRVCVRCGSEFYTTYNKYVSRDSCTYHWGRFQRKYGPECGPWEYTCCRGARHSVGCSQAKLHVWNGPGEIGVGFTETKPVANHPPNGNYGVYSLDCEMSYTVAGLEVTQVTLVGVDGRVVYNRYVHPINRIVDYNTRFSGVTAAHFSRHGSKTLPEVQDDLKKIINCNTVLIGHGLENDLKALRIIHGKVVDTAFTFSHYRGLPYKRSLRSLVNSFLNRDIQWSQKGHDSAEDARACMDLMRYKLQQDFEIE